ncbi:MAG: hypothetical protein JO142_02200 [Burkholderiales bacterium]|nr:hypothetical protein [Burkholderiales bacterium]
MSQQQLTLKDGNNTPQVLSVVQDPSNGNAYLGASTISDPTTGNKVTIAAFHNADNQQPGGTAFGILSGGVAQLLNILGNLDRQRETGIDGVPAQGIASGAASFAMSYKTSISAAITSNASAQVVTPVAMSGTIGGVPWNIQAGSVLTIDTGASQENVLVTATTTNTFTAIFSKNHSGGVIVTGFVFNQERDAAGEADGATGIGTAVAAEYEYNAGAPGGGAFDRARSLQGKGRTGLTITAGGTQGSTSLTLTANTGLKSGMQVTLATGAFPAAGSYETVYVDFSYSEGTNTVPLKSAISLANTYTTAYIDAFSTLGPQLNGFMPTGMGVEMCGLYDPVSGLMFIERAATQDGVSGQNVIVETLGVLNGAGTLDRLRAAPGTLGALAVSTDGVKATYGVVGVAATPAAAATDFVTLSGSASKTVRVKRVAVSGLATTAGTMDVSLVKRTAANTAGTSSAPTIGQHDSTDAAATAAVAQYSVNPTGVGTGVAIKNQKLNFGLAGASGTIVWDFSTRNDKAVVLRGASQFLAINLNGQAVPAGGSISYEIEWEEDNS